MSLEQATNPFGTSERTSAGDSASEVLFMLREWKAAKGGRHYEFALCRVLWPVLLRVFSKKSPITVPKAPCQDLHIEGLNER